MKKAMLKRFSNEIAEQYKDNLVVIYECQCPTDYKEYHHPDYKWPLIVERLCKKCHYQRHKDDRPRINGGRFYSQFMDKKP